MKKRRIKDNFLKSITYLFSSFGVIILVLIMAYVFANGSKNLSWKMITSDYQETSYNLRRTDLENYNLGIYEYDAKKNEFFSRKWGIALIDSKNVEGNKVIEVNYVSPTSPLISMHNIADSSYYKIEKGVFVDKIVLKEDNQGESIYALSKDGAEKMIQQLDKANIITDMIIKKGGGGIRGSIITTILLILLTLMISLPLGIGCAIYLSEYAPKNKFTSFINYLIDMIGGIPSIIFGFFGMFVFIPFCDNVFKTNGGSILSGAFTLSIMLLPTIIKTIEEALKVIPKSYRDSSLSLGASKTQTIFKVVLPNAIGGILTAVVLAIGRIIAESASLIFAIGTVIKDTITINGNGTSLAVHIWSIMGGEKPNFDSACSIAIVILIIVLILNVLIKIIGRKLNKYA